MGPSPARARADRGCGRAAAARAGRRAAPGELRELGLPGARGRRARRHRRARRMPSLAQGALLGIGAVTAAVLRDHGGRRSRRRRWPRPSAALAGALLGAGAGQAAARVRRGGHLDRRLDRRIRPPPVHEPDRRRGGARRCRPAISPGSTWTRPRTGSSRCSCSSSAHSASQRSAPGGPARRWPACGSGLPPRLRSACPRSACVPRPSRSPAPTPASREDLRFSSTASPTRPPTGRSSPSRSSPPC